MIKSKNIKYNYDGDNLEIIFPSKMFKSLIPFIDYKLVQEFKLRRAGGSDNQIDYKWIERKDIQKIKNFIDKNFGKYIKKSIKYNTLYL